MTFAELGLRVDIALAGIRLRLMGLKRTTGACEHVPVAVKWVAGGEETAWAGIFSTGLNVSN